MKQWHHAKRGLQSLSVHSKHRCLPSDIQYLRAEPGLWFPCRRVVQDRGWHVAAFTGRNLINHSHYLSIPCTWAHSPPAQNQQSVSPEPQEHSDGWQRTKGSNAAPNLQYTLGQSDQVNLGGPHGIHPSSLTESREQYRNKIIHTHTESCCLRMRGTNWNQEGRIENGDLLRAQFLLSRKRD